MPTLGGKQFWADELLFHQWRIQRNVLTGHCRLLDENDLRHAYGTFEACRVALEQIRRQRKLPPMQGKGVIVLHGLADSRSVMSPLCGYLEREGGFRVFNVGYPSTRQSIARQAETLARIVAGLDGIEEIHFVGFSLGAIIIRRYLADQSDPATPGGLDPRIKRFVMLGPPNHGAELAAEVAQIQAASLLVGKPLRELADLGVRQQPRLGTPPCQFGIIAGGLGNRTGFNPLLPGDDDGIVTVASARLEGASDFIVVPVPHPWIPKSPKVAEYTLRFLQHGYFVSPERRQPIGQDELGRPKPEGGGAKAVGR